MTTVRAVAGAIVLAAAMIGLALVAGAALVGGPWLAILVIG